MSPGQVEEVDKNAADAAPKLLRLAQLRQRSAEIADSRSVATPASLSTAATTLTRDRSIDVVRGLCLISMAVGHMAKNSENGSVVSKVVHAPLVVDGASGFIFLSGVSLAIADQARVRKGWSIARRARWMLSRAVVLYVLHLVLTVAVVVLAASSAWYGPDLGSAARDGLTASVFGEIVLLQLMIPYLDVLPLYTIFIAFLAPIVLLGPRVHPRTLASLSIALYVFSQWLPETTSLTRPDGEVSWVLGAWQLLFVAGVLLGARWNEVREFLTGPGLIGGLIVGTSALIGIAALRVGGLLTVRLTDDFGDADLTDFFDAVFGKAALEPPRLIATLCFGTLTYLAVDLAAKRLEQPHTSALGMAGWLFRRVEQLGAKGLRSFLVSCAVAVAFWMTVQPNPSQFAHLLAALGVVAIMSAFAAMPQLARGKPWSM